ncbi:hypothetical protein D1Z97_10850 [Riemerella anatipestifer]|uniref:hypothetical protein n=1 Tax=Riemerella anatipestifer TaxID=34085 RepID=UPI00129ED07A|nr:hypothetical protein [Riemerella anatipestifer]MRN01650.1 hypothetical protein [Riemerella anatipestifer]MRN02823.1 hypothetical protein [Riemerella anatipestifer]
MTKKEFLQKSDVSILNYEISDTVDLKGNESVAVFLTVGKTEEQIERELENIPAEKLENNPKISFHEYEIMLSKKELKFLLSEIKKFEVEGADCLNE